MFQFSKGTKKQEDTTDAQEFLKDQKDETESPQENAEANIETTLSIPDNWDISEEEQYVYAFHNNMSPLLKPNQVSIYGMELTEDKNKWIVTGLIRSTIPRKVHFTDTTILLLDGQGNKIARKEFSLGRLGSLPANSARPWTFTFGPNDILYHEDDTASSLPSEWSLAFELKQQHQLDLEKSWEKSISGKTRASLEKVVEQAPALKPGEVNFMAITAKREENGDLSTTILIRSGVKKDIHFEEIALAIIDASNEEVARAKFDIKDLTIKANTSKPWTFVFAKKTLTKTDIDLSKWKPVAIQ